MKKTLVFTLILTLILSVVSIVSAAETTTPEGVTATVEPKTATIEEDGTLQVTVSFSKPVRGGKLYINYQSDVLTLEGMPEEMSKATMKSEVKGSTAGHMGYTFALANEGISQLTYVFKVAEGAEVNASTEVTVEPVADNFTDLEGNIVALTVDGVPTVTVVAKPGTTVQDPEDNQPTEPGTTDPEPAQPSDGNTGDNGTTGGTPTRYPQTGINIALVAGIVVLAVAAGYVVTKKN